MLLVDGLSETQQKILRLMFAYTKEVDGTPMMLTEFYIYCKRSGWEDIPKVAAEELLKKIK